MTRLRHLLSLLVHAFFIYGSSPLPQYHGTLRKTTQNAAETTVSVATRYQKIFFGTEGSGLKNDALASSTSSLPTPASHLQNSILRSRNLRFLSSITSDEVIIEFFRGAAVVDTLDIEERARSLREVADAASSFFLHSLTNSLTSDDRINSSLSKIVHYTLPITSFGHFSIASEIVKVSHH